MTLLQYYVSLRKDLISMINGVKDAGGSLFWDNTTPNWLTRSRLESLYEKYLTESAKFGVYVITRHCECPNPAHGEYPTTNSYGLKIEYRSNSYIWSGGQMYQGKRYCVCPCSDKNKETKHHVIDDVVYDPNQDQKNCAAIESILLDIKSACDNSGDKQPRSAIRENLLLAIIKINDELYPSSMEAYIKNEIEPLL